MLMTPVKLIALRVYNISLGRIPLFSKILKRALILTFIKKKSGRYVASSRYFNPGELDSD